MSIWVSSAGDLFAAVMVTCVILNQRLCGGILLICTNALFIMVYILCVVVRVVVGGGHYLVKILLSLVPKTFYYYELKKLIIY